MDSIMDWMTDLYGHSLRWTLRYRWVVVILSFAVFGISMLFFKTLPKELIPAQDQSLFLLTIKTPVGTSLTATNVTYQKAEAYLKAQPEVANFYTTIGNYENNNVVNAGVIYVILKEINDLLADKAKMHGSSPMTS